MIEADVEKSLAELLVGLVDPRVEVVSLWNSPAVDRTENPQAVGHLTICVPPRQYLAFGLSELQLSPVVALALRVELDPDGTLLRETASAVQGLLQRWNQYQSCEGLDQLSTDEFQAGGLQILPGSGPALNQDNSIVSVVWQFQVQGVATTN